MQNAAHILAVVTLLTWSGLGKQGGQSADLASTQAREFQQLKALTQKQSPLNSQDLALLAGASQSTLPSVRLAGLQVLTARLYTARTTGRALDESVEFVSAVRPIVATMLKDPDERVRHEAILVLGNLEYAQSSTNGQHPFALSPETVTLLAKMYATDPSAGVRAEIVKSFALRVADEGPASGAVADQVLVDALANPSTDVLQMAAMGATRHIQPTAISQLVALLKHDQPRVRLAAVQALVAMSAKYDMRPYVGRLQDAAARESDVLTHKALLAAIARLSR